MNPDQLHEQQPFVSVVMPIKNEGRYIGQCLASLQDQDYPRERMEILVVDGMSTDRTRETVAAMSRSDPRIRLIDNPRGIVSTALNIALPQAKGDVIVRIDGHCAIDGRYVRRCVEHLRQTGVAAVGGPLTTIGTTPVAAAIAAAMSSYFGVGDSIFRVGSQQVRLVDTVAFPAYSREALERAGPFDEELVRNQDDEYSYRLRALGLGILLAPDVRSVYYSRSSIAKLARQYFQYGYWKVRVMQKHPRQMQPRQFIPVLFVLALLTSWLALLSMSTWGAILLSLVIVPYLAASAVASTSIAARTGWNLLAMLPIVFAVLHLSYGAGFLVGLVTFAGRWRDRGVHKDGGWLVPSRKPCP